MIKNCMYVSGVHIKRLFKCWSQDNGQCVLFMRLFLRCVTEHVCVKNVAML